MFVVQCQDILDIINGTTVSSNVKLDVQASDKSKVSLPLVEITDYIVLSTNPIKKIGLNKTSMGIDI